MGLIGRITHMHALYYAKTAHFGRQFESFVPLGWLVFFCDRLESPRNEIWTAVLGDDIVGSIAIDGENLGSGIAHLRWFIVADQVSGSGVGRELLSAALAFVDTKAFTATQLWTFAGLSTARRLYEAHGFACIEERAGDRWGREVLEQRFARSAL